MRLLPRRRSNRGMALVMSLLVVVITALLSLSAVEVATVDARGVRAEVDAVRALDLARAGISRALTELRMDYQWSEGKITEYTLQDGGYAVSVWASPNNPGRATKRWLVTSTGTSGPASRTVQNWLQLDSFARYAYFTDQEQSPNGAVIWFTGNDRITGEAHTNGYFNIAGQPQFSSRLSSANLGDPYFQEEDFAYSQGGDTVTDTSRFYHYRNSYDSDRPTALDASSGFTFQGGQPEIDLPADTGEIASNAQYHFKGAVKIVFKDDGTMIVRENGGPPQTHPLGNTVVYVEGKLEVSGVLDGHVTVGVKGSIDITDNLTYENRTDDVLGLVAEGRIQINTPPGTVRDIEVNASLMALNDSFTVNAYDRGVARGTLTVFGGIIQKYRGPVGTFNSLLNRRVTGYTKNYQYDDKLLNTPPPFFPGNGKIAPHAFIDGSALGH